MNPYHLNQAKGGLEDQSKPGEDAQRGREQGGHGHTMESAEGLLWRPCAPMRKKRIKSSPSAHGISSTDMEYEPVFLNCT